MSQRVGKKTMSDCSECEGSGRESVDVGVRSAETKEIENERTGEIKISNKRDPTSRASAA